MVGTSDDPAGWPAARVLAQFWPRLLGTGGQSTEGLGPKPQQLCGYAFAALPDVSQ